LKDVPNLEYLALSFFPSDLIFSSKIYQLKNLKELSIKHLKVEELEKDAFKMPQLQTLYISFCQSLKIDAWVNEWKKMPNFQTLILNYNKLKRMPEELGTFSSLKKVQFTEVLKDTEFETQALYDEHIKEMRKKLHQANFVVGMYVSDFKFLEP